MSEPVAIPVMFSKYLRIRLLPLRGYVAYMTELCSTAFPVVYLAYLPKKWSFTWWYLAMSLLLNSAISSSRSIVMSLTLEMRWSAPNLYPGYCFYSFSSKVIQFSSIRRIENLE